MFDGYLSLGGTEIINSQRTAAYVRSLIPGLHLRSTCCDCDTLADFLGDAPYSSPLQDEPGWFSPFRTESADFLGLIPLALEGFEDSTHEVSITEVTGDGSVSGRPRRASRDVRVRALMVSTSEKGMDAGMSWLRDALTGSGCATGDCSGDDLCYLASCPELCDDPLTVSILDLDTRAMTEADLLAEATNWRTTSGTFSAPLLAGQRSLLTSGMSGPSEVSRVLTGLTPGATYRVALTIRNGLDSPSATFVDLDVAGSAARITSPHVLGATGEPDTSGAVLEFQATSETHRVVIVPRGIPASDLEYPAKIWITALSVQRTPALSILLSGPVSVSNPGSTHAWSPVAPASGYTQAWGSTLGGFTYTATASRTPAQHTLGASRTIQGLIPGRRYLVRLGLSTSRSGTSTPTLVTFGVQTTDNPWDDTVGAPDWLVGVSADTAWVTYPFTATGTTTTLTVANGQSMTLASGAAYSVEISYLRVEEDVSEVSIEPVLDPARPMRHLRNVTTTSGPRIVEKYPPREAHLQIVEWTMNAGAPRPAGDEITVTRTLGMGSVVVPETDCYNGQPVLTNHIANASFETNLTGWSSVGVNWSAITRVSDPALATAGSYVAKMTATSTVSTPANMSYSLTGLTAGSAYTISVAAGTTASGVRTVMRVSGLTPLGWSQTSVDQNALVPGGVGVRRWITFYVPPGNTGAVTFTVSFNPYDPVPSGTVVWIDAAMATNTAYATQYVDGDVTGGEWSGTAHASKSTWHSPVAAELFDPECPPPPSPPRPPVIINDCVLPSETWQRYTVDIPAQVTQQGTSAFPAVTLTTGATEARGVRVRLYSNPFDLAPDQIDPCAYCGEFLLSYLPPNAALTVDASLRDASIAAQGQTQTAMQFLFGSDGGPLTWPEMDCGVAYLLAVDLDADTPPLIGLELNVIPAF